MALVYTAVPVGTMGTIKAKSIRYDAPDGNDVKLSDENDVVRSLVAETTTPTGKWVAFISVHNNQILFVKAQDVSDRFIGVTDEMIKSIANRTLKFLEVEK